MSPEWLGYTATLASTVCQLPQLIKVMREKHTTSLSMAACVLAVIASVLWLMYGVEIDSPSLTVSSFIGVLLGGIIAYFKVRHG
jgi:MtN3 and saliva related transmembrane protein